MRKQAVDGAVKIPAVGLNGGGHIGRDGGGNVEIGMGELCGGDARLKNFYAKRLVEAADLDAKAAGEARSHALVKAVEVGRRTIGRDDDLSMAVDQGVQRMAELLLDRLALQELNVVDDENIDAAQLFLEGDRGLRLERGDEAIHEALGGEIDDAALRRRGGVGDGLQQMGLAEPHGGMQVERIEQRRLLRRRGGDALRGGEGELVRSPDREIRENSAAHPKANPR